MVFLILIPLMFISISGNGHDEHCRHSSEIQSSSNLIPNDLNSAATTNSGEQDHDGHQHCENHCSQVFAIHENKSLIAEVDFFSGAFFSYIFSYDSLEIDALIRPPIFA